MAQCQQSLIRLSELLQSSRELLRAGGVQTIPGDDISTLHRLFSGTKSYRGVTVTVVIVNQRISVQTIPGDDIGTDFQ